MQNTSGERRRKGALDGSVTAHVAERREHLAFGALFQSSLVSSKGGLVTLLHPLDLMLLGGMQGARNTILAYVEKGIAHYQLARVATS